MGAGWSKGVICALSNASATVQIDRRTTRVYDLRNIQI